MVPWREKFEVPARLWRPGPPREVLRQPADHEERARLPVLRRQPEVRGHRHGGGGRRRLRRHPHPLCKYHRRRRESVALKLKESANYPIMMVVTLHVINGRICVLQTGRLDFNANRVTGHTGPILDIKWNPFNDNVIASCSDDCTVRVAPYLISFCVTHVNCLQIKLWHIPDEGLSMHLTDWLVELQGHKRRVAYIEWHPTAENILFSAGFDHLVRLKSKMLSSSLMFESCLSTYFQEKLEITGRSA